MVLLNGKCQLAAIAAIPKVIQPSQVACNRALLRTLAGGGLFATGKVNYPAEKQSLSQNHSPLGSLRQAMSYPLTEVSSVDAMKALQAVGWEKVAAKTDDVELGVGRF